MDNVQHNDGTLPVVSIASGPGTVHLQLRIQLASGYIFALGQIGRGLKLMVHLHLVSQTMIRAATNPLHHRLSRPGT